MNPYRVVNLRGTNGSGKSTVAQAFIQGAPITQLEGCRGHRGPAGIVVLGPYSTPCGGMDRVSKTAEATGAVLGNCGAGPLLFEGVIISTVFSTWLAVSNKLRKVQERAGAPVEGLVWAYLNTPLEVCLERVAERNGGKAVKTEQITSKWEGIVRQRRKAIDAGELVYDIDYTRSIEEVQWLLTTETL